MSEFIPADCPVGIKNSKNLENQKDRLTMALERFEEKLGDVKTSVETLNDDMTKHLAQIESKLDNNIQETRTAIERAGMAERNANRAHERIDKIKQTFDKNVELKMGAIKRDKVFSIVQWIFVTLGGSLVVAVITSIVLTSLTHT